MNRYRSCVFKRTKFLLIDKYVIFLSVDKNSYNSSWESIRKEEGREICVREFDLIFYFLKEDF